MRDALAQSVLIVLAAILPAAASAESHDAQQTVPEAPRVVDAATSSSATSQPATRTYAPASGMAPSATMRLAPIQPAVSATQPRPQTVENMLLERIQRSLRDPVLGETDDEQRARIEQLIADSEQLVERTGGGPRRLQMLNLQLQSYNNSIANWPDADDVDGKVLELRSAARRTKAMDEPESQSLGDFWLLVADLHEINASRLPLEKRRAQAEPLLERYLAAHPDAPMAPAVRNALAELQGTQQAKRGEAVVETADGDTDRAGAPASTQPTDEPAATQPTTTRPAADASASQPAPTDTE